MTKEEFKGKLRELLEDMKDSDLIEVWNEYCYNTGYMDDYIEFNDPDEFLCGKKPSEVLEALYLERYNPNDSYVVYTIYGYKSFDYATSENSPVDISDIIKYVVDNEESLENDDIDELLEEYLDAKLLEEYEELGDEE
jgi:hypothetical protein